VIDPHSAPSVETRTGSDQEAHHLPLGDHHAEVIEQADQPRHGDLAPDVLRDDEALELGSKVADCSGG
jgi:hypothetical protein